VSVFGMPMCRWAEWLPMRHGPTLVRIVSNRRLCYKHWTGAIRHAARQSGA
jgi:hypothetical protein